MLGTEENDKSFVPAQVSKDFVKGADISSMLDLEECQFDFYDRDGHKKELLEIIKAEGFNYIRLRTWHNPYSLDQKPYGAGTSSTKRNITIAKRAKALGFKLLLDFHYSDFWTDPGKQYKPKAWMDLNNEELALALENYTIEVLNEFATNDVYPDMVQVGNEINNGMLWPNGRLDTADYDEKDPNAVYPSEEQLKPQFDVLASFLRSGIKGVQRANSLNGHHAKIMLHLAQGTKYERCQQWLTEIIARGVDFDVLGLSMYTWWDGSIEKLIDSITKLKSFNKEIMVVETSYGYSTEDIDGPDRKDPNYKRAKNVFDAKCAQDGGYAGTVAGQAAYLRDLMEALSKCGVTGLFYWEVAWKAPKGITWATKVAMEYINASGDEGSGWYNQALFDGQGHVLKSIRVFNNP